MSEARVDQHRRHVELNKGTVQNLLPEYFLGEYPKLVEFLEAYYEYSEVDSVDSFVNQIHDLFKIKSITSTSLTNLDKIIADIGNGLQSSSFFQQPRLMARLLANFYRAKGTQISVEQFFRAFFNESISIEIKDNGIGMNYKINWRQNYPSWTIHANNLLELRVELSGYKEANDVIAYIKSL